MANNILDARIKLKYDTIAHWNLIENTFKPLAGEVIIYQIPAQTTNDLSVLPPAVGIKVGNGTDYLKDLPWIQAIAGDVYSWAKEATKPAYNATEITATKTLANNSTQDTTVLAWLQSLTDDMNSLSGGAGSISTQISNALANLDVDNDSTSALTHHITGFSQSKTLATLIEADGYISATFQDILIAQSQVSGLTDALAAKQDNLVFNTTYNASNNKVATMSDVTNAVAGLSGAMHFKGSTSSTITDGGTETVSINDVALTPAAGDVVLSGNKEFVWTGTAWELLGDEGSYAVKGSISNNDIASNANIDQSKINGTSGTLEDDLALLAPKASPTFTGTVTVPVTPTNNTDAASKKYVDDTAAASNTTYSLTWNSATAVSDKEKLILTPTTNGTTGTPQKLDLKTIATTGSIYDIKEGSNLTEIDNTKEIYESTEISYLIFDCGSATRLISSKT